MSTPATTEQRAQMERDVAAVRAAFAAARPVVEGAASSWFAYDSAQAVLAQLNAQTATLEKWATTWRSWAERGTDGVGDYPVSFWRQVGQDLSNFAADAGKQAKYTLVTTVVRDTAHETAKPFDPSLWPDWVPWALGGVAFLAALAIVAPYLRTLGVLK